MEHLNADSLPREICHRILQNLGKRDLCNCSLVCRAWLPSVHTLLYAKVVIRHLDQLKQFHRTVEQDAQLGLKVKSLMLNIQIWEDRDKIKKEMQNILTALFSTCLPNLEILHDDFSFIYIPLQQALKDSQLKSLKRLEVSPHRIRKDELAEYLSCVLLMKDHLENLYISDSEIYYGEQLFHRLHSQIHEFDHLKEVIVLSSATDKGIMVLDSIVERCSSTLKEIIFFAHRSNSNNSEEEVYIDSIIPRTNIKWFTVDKVSDIILTYLMRKFPQLEICSLREEGNASQKTSPYILEQFSHYVSRLKEFYVHETLLEHDMIVKVMGSYWKGASSAYGKQRVHFCYSEEEDLEAEKLFVHKDYTSIDYPFSSESDQHDWKHVDFIKENGKYLKRAEYAFFLDDPEKRMVMPDNFIFQTLAYCPWIQDLHLEYCTMKPLGALHSNSEKRYSLKQLSLLRCTLQEGALESLSTVLSDVSRLKVFDIDYDSDATEVNQVIRMPHTRVIHVIFVLFRGASLYLKVTNSIDGNPIYYCVLHSDKRDALPLTEEEFLVAPIDDRVEVCCETNPIIQSEFYPLARTEFR